MAQEQNFELEVAGKPTAQRIKNHEHEIVNDLIFIFFLTRRKSWNTSWFWEAVFFEQSLAVISWQFLQWFSGWILYPRMFMIFPLQKKPWPYLQSNPETHIMLLLNIYTFTASTIWVSQPCTSLERLDNTNSRNCSLSTTHLFLESK